VSTQTTTTASRWIRSSLIACSLGIASPALAQNTQSHILSVGAWYNDLAGGGGVDTNFWDPDSNAMFAAANNVVQLADQMGDAVCNHAFGLSGTTLGIHSRFSDGDIDNAPEMDLINSFPVFVKVVPKISICGDVMVNNIGGCAGRGNLQSIVLAEYAVKGHPAAGVAMAHEYGHAVGLDHEKYQIFNFMWEEGDANNRSVSALQCQSLRSDALRPLGPPADLTTQLESLLGTPQVAPMAGYILEVGAAPPTIEDLASRVLFEVPLGLESIYTTGDLQKLFTMLQNGVGDVYQPTIITLIGLLSGERADDAAAALVQFADAHNGNVAARTAIGALGHLAERGSSAALNKLLDYAAPTRGANVSSAVVGLGLSGRAEARARLEELLQDSAPPLTASNIAEAVAVAPDASFRPYAPATASALPPQVERDTVALAIRANQAIAAVGRDGYYAP
jgi:hypothetical protein